MPRLIGKTSKAPLYIGTVAVVAIAGVLALEYYGVIDIIPNFGRENKEMWQPSLPPRRTSSLVDEDF
jgi:hypothetical protein